MATQIRFASWSIALVAAAALAVVAAAGETTTYFWGPQDPEYDAYGVPTSGIMVSLGGTKPPSQFFPVLVASAVYNASLFDYGWDTFTVSPVRTEVSTTRGWYAAGYAEGYLLMERINQTMAAQNVEYTTGTTAFINQQIDYMWTQSLANKAKDPFWAQIQKQMVMMRGIADGYAQRQHETGFLFNHTFWDVVCSNLFPEYTDIEAAVSYQNFTGEGPYPSLSKSIDDVRKGLAQYAADVKLGASAAHRELNNPRFRPIDPSTEHCSALIKVTADNIFMGQSTWMQYLYYPGRLYKTYVMETAVSMSASAGRIHSSDDWYQTSNLLGSMETSNEFTTNDLLNLIHPNSVAEFMRVMVANNLATNGKEWVEYFGRNNSGTYCNQWMVVDFKLYTKGMRPSQLPDDLFWLAEEIPGKVVSADLTWFLRENSYWGSYNIPYFPDIYDLSGFTYQLDTYGSFFSWADAPRAQIFRRIHVGVVDLPSMQKTLRYNNWEKDELSTIPNCDGCNPARNPSLAIASRFDLTPKTSTYGNLTRNYAAYFKFGYFGSLDGKITSYDYISNGMLASFQQGPTHDTQPVFEWPADAWMGRLPGMPQRFDFGWYTFSPKQSASLPSPKSARQSAPVLAFRAPSEAPKSQDQQPAENHLGVILGATLGGGVALFIVGGIIGRFALRRSKSEHGGDIERSGLLTERV